jgi:hypothetical protein
MERGEEGIMITQAERERLKREREKGIAVTAEELRQMQEMARAERERLKQEVKNGKE